MSGHRAAPQTLIGGAPVSMQVLAVALRHAPRLIAADGGADTALRAGLMPDRVVGDMDSISDAARAAFADRLHGVAEQDSTDFAKALTACPGATIGVGFTGARVDHFLACLTELARRRAGPPVVLLGEEDCLCIVPHRALLRLPVGTRLSLWPLGPACGTSEGLQWPIDGLDLAPDGRVGTSNRTVAPVVRLTVRGAAMALILPAGALDAMLAMLDFPPCGGQVAPT